MASSQHQDAIVIGGFGGTLSFSIYQTPLVEDDDIPEHQRVYTPDEPKDESCRLPASVALHMYDAAQATKWKPATRARGADYLLAVENDQGIAIRAHDATDGWTFRVKIMAGGINVASPSPVSSLFPDYLVMPDHEWVFGTRAAEDLVRQFRVVESGTNYSIASALGRREDEASIEIQITGIRERKPPKPRPVPTRSVSLPEARDGSDTEADIPLTVARTKEGFQVYVKTLTGKTLCVGSLSKTATVDDLKEEIQKMENSFTKHQQRLIYKGESLDDSRTLRSYNIREGDTLHLVLRLRGGGGSIMSALSSLPLSEKDKLLLSPKQLGPGGLIKQSFAGDPTPDDWGTAYVHTMRFYFFDPTHFKAKTGLDLNPHKSIEGAGSMENFVERRLPPVVKNPRQVWIPSISQLYKRFKGHEHQLARNANPHQNEEVSGQQEETAEEPARKPQDDRRQQARLAQQQIWKSKALAIILCARE